MDQGSVQGTSPPVRDSGSEELIGWSAIAWIRERLLGAEHAGAIKIVGCDPMDWLKTGVWRRRPSEVLAETRLRIRIPVIEQYVAAVPGSDSVQIPTKTLNAFCYDTFDLRVFKDVKILEVSKDGVVGSDGTAFLVLRTSVGSTTVAYEQQFGNDGEPVPQSSLDFQNSIEPIVAVVVIEILLSPEAIKEAEGNAKIIRELEESGVLPKDE